MLARLAERVPEVDPLWGPAASHRRRLALLVAAPVLFLLGGLVFGPGARAALFALYAAFFLLLAAIDLEHRIVPNRLVLPAIVIAPLAALLWGHSPLGLLLGGALHLGFFALSAVLFRGGIGMGDVKLAALLGILTGFPGVFMSLMASALLSGVVSGLLVLTRIRSLRDYIPFAPFMLAGALIALLVGSGSFPPR